MFKEFIKTSLLKPPTKYKLAASDVETVLFDLVREDKYEPTVVLDDKNMVKSISVKTTNNDKDYINHIHSKSEIHTENLKLITQIQKIDCNSQKTQ